MQRFHLYLPPQMVDVLRADAVARGVSISEVVRYHISIALAIQADQSLERGTHEILRQTQGPTLAAPAAGDP